MTPSGFLLFSLPLLVIVASSAAAESPAPTGKFEAFVELPGEAPYVGEPLRLVLRSAIRARVANDRIVQPALTDFDWQQFGVDASSEELLDGFWTPAQTRVLMIYPLRAGRLAIEPFKRRVTYFNDEGERLETELVSQPITIDVRPRDGVGEPADFWLPAKSVRIVDRWEPDPDKIPLGETAERIVVVEAEGVTADRLPPLPRFRAPGVITFAGPVERQTIVTDRGPVGRATYLWKVRPVSTTPAAAPAIRVPWFDISERRMREAEAPERRLAFVDAEQEAQLAASKKSHSLLAPRPLVAALFGFVATGAACLVLASKPADGGSWRHSWRLYARRRRLLHALHAAARKSDVPAFRRAIDALSRNEPERWRRIVARDDVAAALASIDAAIFAREAPPAPALSRLAQPIAYAFRRTGVD